MGLCYGSTVRFEVSEHLAARAERFTSQRVRRMVLTEHTNVKVTLRSALDNASFVKLLSYCPLIYPDWVIFPDTWRFWHDNNTCS